MRKKLEEQKEPKTTKQLGVQVDKDQWRRFRLLAFKQGRTATDLLKEAIDEYLATHEEDTHERHRFTRQKP